MSRVWKDWRSLPDGREKYQLYLASREWAVKKEAVRRRSGGICERCHYHKMDAVHHLTYARKYAEPLEDLAAICNGCHEFTHNKSNHDPVKHVPVTLLGRTIRSVYLAGKITGTDWRGEIVPDWTCNAHDSSCAIPGYMSMNQVGNSFREASRRARAELPGGRALRYLGPFWVDLGGGHGNRPNSIHAFSGTGNHGCEYVLESESLKHLCLDAITEADLVFAWLDRRDCYGSLAELGYAAALNLATVKSGYPGPLVVIAMPEQDRELWFVSALADLMIYGASAGDAWGKLWSSGHHRQADGRPHLVSEEIEWGHEEDEGESNSAEWQPDSYWYCRECKGLVKGDPCSGCGGVPELPIGSLYYDDIDPDECYECDHCHGLVVNGTCQVCLWDQDGDPPGCHESLSL